MIVTDGWEKQRTDCKTPEDYSEAVCEDFLFLAPYIKDMKSIMDIGCGIGGIDVWIYKAYKPQLYLVDSTEDVAPKYGYREKGEYYNSLNATSNLMEANGVDTYTIIDSKKDDFPESVDCVISTLSWCYHYPVQEYWDRVLEMNPKKIIVDLRKSAPTPIQFTKAELILETDKYRRVCLCL